MNTAMPDTSYWQEFEDKIQLLVEQIEALQREQSEIVVNITLPIRRCGVKSKVGHRPHRVSDALPTNWYYCPGYRDA